MIAINIACIGMITFFSLGLLKLAKVENLNTARWFIPALIMFSPFVSNVIWQGQTSLIVTAALVGSWYFYRTDRSILAGILLAIAGIKPHLALLIAIWFLLERQWKLLASATVAFLLLSWVPIIRVGPIEMWIDWLSTAMRYQDMGVNRLGSIQIFGIQNLLYKSGVENIPSLFPLGILLAGILWKYRSRFAMHDKFGLLLSITALFGYLHAYDLVFLTPLIAVFWIHLCDKVINSRIIMAFLLMFLMFLPRRLFTYHFPEIVSVSSLLLQYRTLLFLGITVWLFIMALQPSSKETLEAKG